jgi:hypothetical protein
MEERMASKRIFISFAVPEDNYARDFLVGQAKNNNSPFEFIDMSVKEPWDSSWKTRCRERIKGCDGVIVLLSKYTSKADGANWEIKCAKEEGIRIIGVLINKDENAPLPAELSWNEVINWTWDGIARFISSL